MKAPDLNTGGALPHPCQIGVTKDALLIRASTAGSFLLLLLLCHHLFCLNPFHFVCASVIVLSDIRDKDL